MINPKSQEKNNWLAWNIWGNCSLVHYP